jgi:hypothetical protein
MIASVLEVTKFHVGPSPFNIDCTFGYTGAGVASVMSIEIHDLVGAPVWSNELPT